MNNIENSNKAVFTLVADRPPLQTCPIFVTVSPNPNTKHAVTRPNPHSNKQMSLKMKYGELPQRVQFDYCMKIVRTCYVPFLSTGSYLCGSWELNSTGNVHLHFLIFDKAIKNDTFLQVYRRDIMNCSLVLENRSKGSSKDYMNNIVFLNKPLKEVVEYIDKDFEKNQELFTNYYVTVK